MTAGSENNQGTDPSISALCDKISKTAFTGLRRVVALVGPPASGKSTLAAELATHLPDAAVLGMDGFHLDNAILKARARLHTKGAPDTFDALGFRSLVQRLKTDATLYVPVFDRSQEITINAAEVIGPEVKTVIVEGNYLLLKSPLWQDLRPHWDLSMALDVPLDQIETRLLARWRDLELAEDEVHSKVYGNDLPNARIVRENSFDADMIITPRLDQDPR